MNDRIDGVPEGYRLGDVVYLREDRQNITFELIPIEPEQPKQLEAVIVVPIAASGLSGRRISLDSFLSYGLDHYWANLLAVDHPDRVTIREKGMGRREQGE